MKKTSNHTNDAEKLAEMLKEMSDEDKRVVMIYASALWSRAALGNKKEADNLEASYIIERRRSNLRKQRRYDEIMKDLQETNAGDRKRIRRLCNELKRFRVCSRRERIGDWIEHMVFHYGYALYALPALLFFLSFVLMMFNMTR